MPLPLPVDDKGCLAFGRHRCHIAALALPGKAEANWKELIRKRSRVLQSTHCLLPRSLYFGFLEAVKLDGHVPSARNYSLHCIYFYSEIAFSYLRERDCSRIEAQWSISFCGHSDFGTAVMKLVTLFMKTHWAGNTAGLHRIRGTLAMQLWWMEIVFCHTSDRHCCAGKDAPDRHSFSKVMWPWFCSETWD